MRFSVSKRGLVIIIILFLLFAAAWNMSYSVQRIKSYILGRNVEDSPGQAAVDTYPLILLHGFTSYSKRLGEWSFLEVQESLVDDLSYESRGVYVPEITCLQLRYTDEPTIIRASFYQDYFRENMQNYTENLALIIDRVLYCTGAQQVDIITHSMGGIVSRNYLKQQDAGSLPTVRKLIMMGAPNHGGLYNGLDLFEKVSGEDYDFLQLKDSSTFLEALNAGDETPGTTQYYTIIGDVDGIGDGVVEKASVPLDGERASVTVDCNHILIKSPAFCEESYAFVVQALTQ